MVEAKVYDLFGLKLKPMTFLLVEAQADGCNVSCCGVYVVFFDAGDTVKRKFASIQQNLQPKAPKWTATGNYTRYSQLGWASPCKRVGMCAAMGKVELQTWFY